MKLTERAKARFLNRASASQEKKIKTTLMNALKKSKLYWSQEWRSAPQQRVVLASSLALLFMIGSAYIAVDKINATQPWTKVFTNGTYVGMVPNNPETIRTLESVAHGYKVNLSTEPVSTQVPANYNWQRVAQIPTKAVAIRLNGKPVVYTTDQKAATQAIAEVAKVLTPNSVSKHAVVAFTGSVDTATSVIGVSQILSGSEATRYLLNPHTTLSGRSGARFAMATLNHAKSKSVTPKTAPSPLLQVKVVDTSNRATTLPYSIRYVKTDQLGSGVVKVEKSGKPGRATDVVKRTFIDGKLVSQVVLKRTVLNTAVQEVALEGTNSGLAAGSWIWPSPDTDVTSPFGWRDMSGWKNFHPGIDIGCPIGTPVYATNNGVVEEAGWNSGGYGNWALVNNGSGIQTVFGHMSHVVVHAGETIAKGQLIGYSGETGEATGPHLHYEVRLNGTPIEPGPYM